MSWEHVLEIFNQHSGLASVLAAIIGLVWYGLQKTNTDESESSTRERNAQVGMLKIYLWCTFLLIAISVGLHHSEEMKAWIQKALYSDRDVVRVIPTPGYLPGQDETHISAKENSVSQENFLKLDAKGKLSVLDFLSGDPGATKVLAPAIVSCITNPKESAKVRAQACLLVSQYHAATKEILTPDCAQALAQALGDNDMAVRFYAVQSLGILGADASHFKEDVKKIATYDPASQVRKMAEKVLPYIP